MTYVLAPNNILSKYPYSIGELRRANPDVSFSSAPPDSLLAQWGVFPVTIVPAPARTTTHNPIELPPQRVNGVWTQQWGMEPASAEEVATRTEQAAQLVEFDAAKLDAWVLQFLAMTPAGAQDFVNANGATVAALRINVARLAYVVRVLVRREFNR